MKKILIFLTILYLTSCESSPCINYQNPRSSEECIGKETSNEENECCYYQFQGRIKIYEQYVSISGGNCAEIEKTKDLKEFKTEREESQRKNGNKYSMSVIFCKDRSYIPNDIFGY